MKINGKNYLLAEKRGCNFLDYDKNLGSDVGNYRVFIRFINDEGEEVSGDVTLNRKTGELSTQMYRYDAAANCYGFSYHWTNKRNTDSFRGYPYTLDGILRYVNDRSAEPYDEIKWVQTFTFDQDPGSNFTPSWKITDWARREHLEYWQVPMSGVRVKTYTGTWKYMMAKTRTHYGTLGPFERVTIFLEEAAPPV